MLAPADQGTDILVPVPAHLRHLGESITARISGNPLGPLVVVLGGISADRFIAAGEDGGPGWWRGVIGSGSVIDPARFRILGLDFAADENGLAAPSTADQADILAAALDAVGAERADLLVGASYGAMVELALAEKYPERVGRLVIVSAPASPHPASTATRELQRRIVALGLASGRGEEGLAIARGLAMMTYRTPEEFAQRFEGGIPDEDPLGVSQPGAYLRARGQAYRHVMGPGRFLSLSASIDRHRVDPARIAAPTLLIGATSDRLVPPEQMQELAQALPDARLHLIDCLYGHDMFLKEPVRIGALIAGFLEEA